MKRRLSNVVGVCMLVLLAACSSDETLQHPEAETGVSEVSETLQSESVDGPVTATVTVTPALPLLGDVLTLTLTVVAVANVTVEMPAFGEALGRFSILDFTPRNDVGADGATVATQRYTLQPPMSGRQRIPQLRIEYLDRRSGADAEYRELLTDEVSVEIQSVLPEGAVATELRPARGPLEEHLGSTLARWWPALVAAVSIIGAGAWAAIVWQRRALERVRITAFDRAMGRLEALASQGAPEAAAADAWYVELSDIVRRYIEDRYAVRAPELTTEEFLQEARRSVDFSAAHRNLLSSLLERCDRVKFARYSPEDTESVDALNVARLFLSETQVEVELSEQQAA